LIRIVAYRGHLDGTIQNLTGFSNGPILELIPPEVKKDDDQVLDDCCPAQFCTRRRLRWWQHGQQSESPARGTAGSFDAGARTASGPARAAATCGCACTGPGASACPGTCASSISIGVDVVIERVECDGTCAGRSA
jgi:hypothetical protein